MKIPFSIDYKPQIESGEYKVVIGYDWPIEILSWNCIHCNNKGNSYPILAKIRCMNPDGQDFIHWYNEEGKYDPWDGITLKEQDAVPYCPGHDLFILTPEPELSEWEIFISGCLQKHGLLDCGAADRIAQNCSAELLELARKEFIKQNYVIEKKAFHDAVEKIDDKHKAAMSVEYSLHCKVENGTRHAVMNWNEFQKVAQHFIDCGKAEALKDLPRWKSHGAYAENPTLHFEPDNRALLSYRGRVIFIDDLEKLPGFNE